MSTPEEEKKGTAGEEAGIDFSQVPLSQMEDKGTSKNVFEDENFEF